jgi:serine phosphatase RsbU (regulator of sigma subunit)
MQHTVDRRFENHELNLNEGDLLYLYSDGFMDQFGGEKGKRLKRKNFLTMNENSTTFQAHHDDQKSVLEQLNEIKTERAASNRMLLERRNSSKQMAGGEVKLCEV